MGSPWELDDLLNALSVERRRVALRVIEEHQSALSLPCLAEEVAVREYDAAISDLSSEEVRSIHRELYHVHIPKLSDVGVVKYDRERDMVAPPEAVDQLATVVEMMNKHEPKNARE